MYTEKQNRLKETQCGVCVCVCKRSIPHSLTAKVGIPSSPSRGLGSPCSAATPCAVLSSLHGVRSDCSTGDQLFPPSDCFKIGTKK